MELSFQSSGLLKIIPKIKKGGIIKLSGRNGIGKSMAAIFLEIAAGNHRFDDEDTFLEIKKHCTDCKIDIKLDYETLSIKMTPGLWKFKKNEKKVVEKTIGRYLFNGKSIDFAEFKKILDVKVIRGNENLEEQINIISNFFIDVITDYYEKNKNINLRLKTYQANFYQIFDKNAIDEYKDSQHIYETTETEIIEREKQFQEINSTLKEKQEISTILQKIINWQENDPKKITEEIQRISSDLEEKKADLDLINKKIRNFEQKISKLEEKVKNQIEEIRDSREKLNIKRINLIGQIKRNFGDLSDDIIQAKDLEIIEDILTSQKNTLINHEQQLRKVVQDNKITFELIGKIESIQNIVNESIGEGFENEWIIDSFIQDDLVQINFGDFSEYLTERINVLKSNMGSNNVEEQIIEIRKSLELKKDLIKIIEEWKGNFIELRDLKKKFQNLRKNKLDQFIGIENVKDFIELEEKERKNKENLEIIITDLQIKKSKLEERKEFTKNLEPLEELKDLLKKYSLTSAVNYKEELDRCYEEIDGLKANSLNIKQELDTLRTKRTKLETHIDVIRKKLTNIALESDFSNFKDYLDYFERHDDKLSKLINLFSQSVDSLKSLRDTIDFIMRKKKIKNKSVLNIVNTVYNDFFLDTYNQPEFFELVFQGYRRIKSFNIQNKKIEFLTNSGSLAERSLKDFSSGEKSYAFIRAMMSMSMSDSKYRVIFIDEANAVLDYIRSGDLLKFQEQLIRNKQISKIINILPIHEDLKDLIEEKKKQYEIVQKSGDLNLITQMENELNILDDMKSEYLKLGYYQEIIMN